MNQGKLEVVKQGMARVNINILGISKLKWSGMGEFNSDDHYIYYCGQESPGSVGAQYATGDQWRNNSRKNEGMDQSKNNTQLWM